MMTTIKNSIFAQQNQQAFQANKASKNTPFAEQKMNQQTPTQNSTLKSKEMRTLLRNLNQPQEKKDNPFAVTTTDLVDSLFSKTEDTEDELPKEESYNYKEVSSKIQQAKTSQAAGQAVLAAKRKVLEIKRKIAAGNGDAKEMQLALSHAKRMEMVARKKKHHLELEELVANTGKRDEREELQEEAVQDMKNSLLESAQEKLSEKEDAILEEREELLDSFMEEMQEAGIEISEDMMADYNQMLSEMGEDLLEELEESMEMLEDLEMVDPHMSKEDLEELKRKHRNAENKAIMKADMEYLKEYIKYQLEKGGSMPGLEKSTASMGQSLGFSVSVGDVIESTVSATPEMGAEIGGETIDVQI